MSNFLLLQGFIQDCLPGGELDSMSVFLNVIYGLLGLALVLLLSFIWQWFSKCKK